MKTRNGLTKFWFSTLLFLFIASPSAHAIKFTNQFIEFELPFKWNCMLEGAEWVCQSTDDNKKRDGIIVLAAKLKGDQDDLLKYQDHLTKPRTFSAPNGKLITSQPKYARQIQLNGQPWVDSLHTESEIPGFYTRYLATVKEDIGILVTYSVNKAKFTDYQPQFEDMVKSLKAFRKRGAPIAANPADQSIFNAANSAISNITGAQVFPNTQGGGAAKQPKPKKEEDNTTLYLVLGGAVVAFILYKRRKQGGGGV
jgi:hypothetical protein